MKILIFSDCYVYGGSERLMIFLLKNDFLNKNNTLLFAYRKHKDYEEGLRNENILDRKYNYPLFLLSNETLFLKINDVVKNGFVRKLIKIPFYLIEKVGLYFIWNLIRLMHFLLKVKPEIIHVNNGGYPAAKSCNIMVVANYLTVRTKVIYQVNNQARKRKTFLEKIYDAFINKNVVFFINASYKAKQQLIEKRNFDSDKILVVNNCVPLPNAKLNKAEIFELIKIPQDSFLIVEVAFLSERKGQKYLVEALKELFDKKLLSKEKVFCAFIGNGEDEEFLRNYINDLGLTSNIFLLGYRTNSEDFIMASDLFVLPSIKDEDMPLVILSALGYGKAIISTDFAGISQVIKSNFNGILIKNEIETFAHNLGIEILRLYNDKELRNQMGINAKETYVDYSPETYGIVLNKIYKRLYAI
ncbi:glycosyltransferase family 4 protein [Flavobacterium sp. CFS9]|uniref:Glycosyltransferase family 4 protein n=1 Tax=Flavobacterium sp. CFS9 TaxID=3143118 RepID=A0AAT9GYN5_9FLAO